MYIKVKIMYNMTIVFMLNDRKNPVARYRLFLGTLYLTENRFSQNEMWRTPDNNNDTCHTRAKGFLYSSFY